MKRKALVLLSLACVSLLAQTLPPLRTAGNLTTLELSPVLVAADGIYPGKISVINGGIPAIMNGSVEVATNAETQLLRQSVDDPDLRVIFTVAESFYRIVGRRSAGIRTVRDLKGKRITTPRNTSAHYFLVRMLATVKLSEPDVTLVDVPSTEMAAALKDRRVDAIAMWEPESERAIAAVGADAVVLQDRRVYRELFNLNTSAKVLSDPEKRRAVVELLRSLIVSSKRLQQRPQEFWPLISSKLGYSPDLLAQCWPNLRYAGGLAGDLLDVMEVEERWVAQERHRMPRPRAELAHLIDPSLLHEAVAQVPKR